MSVSSGYIGRSIPRREDEYLLRGLGRFVDDVPQPDNLIHLGFVLSPHSHARILSIDTDEARRLPGVIDVLTGADVADWIRPLTVEIQMQGYQDSSRDVLARDKVRFVGEHVAVILAENPYIAQDAIDLVRVEYEQLPAAVQVDAARAHGAPLVHEHIQQNIMFSGSFATAGFDEAFGSGDLRIRERFKTGRVASVPMEPRGCLAVPEHGGSSIVFYASTQAPHLLRTALAQHVGCSEASLRVVVPDVGGGFGMKAHVYPEDIIVAALALRYRRAVKWVQDRREELLTNIHAREHVYDVEASVSKDGVINAVRLNLTVNAGAYSSYPEGCTLEATGGARMLLGPYRVRNYAYEVFAIATHTCPTGAYRGVAQPACFLAMEGLIDRIGRRLGIDPAEVRLRNLVPTSELPWVNVVGVRYDTGSYEESLRRAMDMVGYDAFRKGQPANRLVDGCYRGIGICCFAEVSGTGAVGWRVRGLTRIPGFDGALVRVEPTGKVTAFISHATAGQGHLTTFAQVLADQLHAPIEDITIVEGDTSVSPYGTGTIASRSAITGGGALIRAGEKITTKMKRIAAHMLEADENDIVLRNGRAELVGVSPVGVTYEQIAATAYSMTKVALPPGEEYGLQALEYYDPPLVTMANAVHIACVSVDASDARVSIDKYIIVHDCGRVINPMIVEGQIHGGTAQGIGEALMEEIVYGPDGQLLNASLLDYLLPSALDVPDYQVDHIESPSIDTLGGFKGVGENGIIGAVPAVTNAVADALAGIGCNVNQIPLRPAYLAALIRDAGPNAASAAAPLIQEAAARSRSKAP